MLKRIKKLGDFLEKLVSRLPFLGLNEEQRLREIFRRNKKIDPEIKLRFYFIFKELNRQHRKPFGMILVLGWQEAWNEKYASVLDADQNIFSGQKEGIEKTDSEIIDILKNITDFDGAILADKNGFFKASGIYLDNMNPKEVADLMSLPLAKDLSGAFGFKKKVHTRHLVAIAASYRLDGTTIYVVSEEDRSLRVFENGKIIWSSVYGEQI